MATRISWQLSFNPWPGEHSNERGQQPSGAGVTHFPLVVWGEAELSPPLELLTAEGERKNKAAWLTILAILSSLNSL